MGIPEGCCELPDAETGEALHGGAGSAYWSLGHRSSSQPYRTRTQLFGSQKEGK